jgi:glycosyltransferase involved in cell wall biosynthesis
MHICHLITGLGTGGTPVMLRKLLESLQGSSLRFTVIGMISDNAVGEQIEKLGIPVHRLGMRAGRPSARGIWQLMRLLKSDPPDLLQTWLYHADLLGSAVAPFCGRPPVVWNIRHATLTPGVDSRSTLLAARLGARLSWRSPRAVVINTESGKKVHIDAGYDPSRFEVLPNGFEVARFAPSVEARRQLRTELGLAIETPLVGLVARYSRLKGQDVFVRAMKDVAAQHPDLNFVLCGQDISWGNAELAAMIETTGCRGRWHLLGPRQDTPRIQAALDLAVCPSLSEAFSNSIGEALSCGVPCVASDVGDSALLIGEAGMLVPPGDATALAAATGSFFSLGEYQRFRLSQLAREQILQRFDIQGVAGRYERLWFEIANASKSVRRAA